MKKKAMVTTDLKLSNVYKGRRFVKNFISKYTVGSTWPTTITSSAAIETFLSELNRQLSGDVKWEKFTQCVVASDETGRRYQLVANPNTGDRVLTVRNASNELLAKFATNSRLIEYKRRATA